MNLPWSNDAEQQVIGVGIIKPSCLDDICVENGLTAKDFYGNENRKIFSCILKMWEDDKQIEPLSVALALGYKDGDPRKQELAAVVKNVVTTYSVEHYAKIVKDFALRRKYMIAAGKMQNICSDTSQPIDKITDEIDGMLVDEQADKETFSAADVFTDVYNSIMQRYEKKGNIPGERTGWLTLDKKIGGMEAGELIIVGARPGMGKSIFAQNIAENIAFNSQKFALMFSLEMPKNQVVQRIISSRSGVLARNTKFGTLSVEDFNVIGNLASDPHLQNIIINDKAMADIAYIKAVCRHVKRKVKDRLGVIIIDYLQLMRMPDSKWNKSDAMQRLLVIYLLTQKEWKRNLTRRIRTLLYIN